VRFIISQYPIVDLGLDTILCGNFNLTLDAGNPGASYRWEPYGENTQKIKVNEQITYRVFVTNSDGCESSDDFSIGKDCISTYWIPNSFSPNDDNLNDVFKPQLVNYERFSLVIFNRWGEILFESQNPDQGWDGTYQGVEVPNGIYFFNMRFITTEDSQFVTQSGQIHLLR
jgi:gliding motility-associated-like protein